MKSLQVVAMLLLICTNSNAGLPPSSWYFGSSFNRIIPDAERELSGESGPRYHLGHTLGKRYALDLAYQKNDFSVSGHNQTLTQVNYTLALRRYFDWDDDQWFLSLEGGENYSELSELSHSSTTYGVGVGYQITAWENGPAVAADIRYLVDQDEKFTDPTQKQFADWFIGVTIIIPFYSNEPESTPARRIPDKPKKKIRLDGTYSNVSKAKGQASPVDKSQPTPPLSDTGVPQSNSKQQPTKQQPPSTEKDSTGNQPVSKKTGLDSTPLDKKSLSKQHVTAGKAGSANVKKTGESSTKVKTKTEASGKRVESDVTAATVEIQKADFSNRINQASQSATSPHATTQAKSTSDKPVPDSDGDGVNDDEDQCGNTPVNVPTNTRGCPLDTDGDSVADFRDTCRGTPRGIKVDERGCGFDSDGDGVANFRDRCKNTPNDVSVDGYGCELDSDGDGVVDSRDQCAGSAPGIKVLPTGCS